MTEAPNVLPEAAPQPDRQVRAICSLDCPDSCGVLVTVRETGQGAPPRAIKVQGDPAHPVTRGFLCGKVARYLDRVYAPDRLLHPMRRRRGVPKGPLPAGRELEAFERISWDQALEEIASKLQHISDQYGPEAILPYSYAGTIGQLGYGSMDRRFFHRLGASQLDRTICASAGAAALTSVYGTRMGVPPQEFIHARLILAWGANIHGNSIHLWPFIEQARRTGARLIVIDPYRTRTAALADQHLAIRPGTDGLLALGLMHVIFRDGLDDTSYLRDLCHGGAELRAHALLPSHAPARVADLTGIPAETIEELAHAYATTRPAVIRVNYGVQRSENGGTAVRAIAMLPLVTGAWRTRGGGLLLSTSGAFSFNSHALQRPDLMLASPLGRPARMVNMNQLGHALTCLGREPVDAQPEQTAGPQVKALFVYNSNPASVAPNQNAVLAGLRRPDLFTVVHEQFLTDTADYADILLPATTWLEAPDVQGSYGHLHVGLTTPAIPPCGEARTNVALFAELARRMGFQEPCFQDSAEDLIDQALTTADPRLAGITRQRLEAQNYLPLHIPLNHKGEMLPFTTPEWFGTPHGRAELLPVPEFIPVREGRTGPGAAQFPLEFLPRKADHWMNTTFASHPGHRAMERTRESALEMHPEDAIPRGIATGDTVLLWNGRGSLRLRADVGSRIVPGTVSALLDWSKLQAMENRADPEAGGGVNVLTGEELTDLGGGATFYSTLVEVRRIASRSGPDLHPNAGGEQHGS